MITEKDEEEEEEPKLTWYQLDSKPNHLKFLVLLFGVPESDDISDEFIEDYNILLVRGCAVKQDKPVPIEVKVPLASENNFKPAEVYRIFYKQHGVVKVHIKGSLITSTKLLMFTFSTFKTPRCLSKILYTSADFKLYSDANGTFALIHTSLSCFTAQPLTRKVLVTLDRLLLKRIPHTMCRTVRGVTHEGVSLSIPGNEK
ncbi:hypothetical protein Tco_1477477, partial [Tanacetum coccineum]